ncbi:MAG: hypothetical protein KatS3mg105_3857 [Gemmatales bacterium]|nr:MAG: hypothetical protein KatS3mg105_3857 [Gemmatales bacterium]
MFRYLCWASASLLLALPVEAQQVSIEVKKESVDFLIDGKLAARYNKGPNVAKPYFWPVYAPNGEPITRGWPMIQPEDGGSTDHIHQKSLWFCHGEVIYGGKKVDFWSEHKGHGKIVCTKVAEPVSDKNHAYVATQNEWRTSDGKKILDETRTIHLFAFGKHRLLVFDIDLYANDGDITFGDTKEGSFGVRVNDRIREVKGGKIENALGKTTAKACWGRKADWCDYSGRLGDDTVGVAIFDHPKNPARACFHVRNYGLMAANPFGRKAFPDTNKDTKLVMLPNGKHLRFRYGVLIHPGDAKEGKVAAFYKKFLDLTK